MIVFDTETTNLIAPEAAPLDQQPHMVEFAAIKLHPRTLEEQARLSFLINPRVNIPPDATAIHGINNAMVAKEPPFIGRYWELCEFFGGQRVVCAHNLSFDLRVMYYELKRADKVTAFPWPPSQVCTVEKTVHLKGHRLGLDKLHELLGLGEHKDGAHRAIVDVEALVRCVRVLRERRIL